MRLKFPLPFPLLTLDCEKFIMCINITQKIFVTVICYLARKGIIVCGLDWSVFDHSRLIHVVIFKAEKKSGAWFS